jgi:hypothetical protein
MSNAPIEAEVLPSPFPSAAPPPQGPSGRKVGVLLGCLGVFLLVMTAVIGAAGYGVWQVVQIAQQEAARQQERRSGQLASEASSSARSAEIVAAFSADDTGVDPDQLQEIQQLFDDALKVKDKPASSPEVSRLFDIDTFVQRFNDWPDGVGLSYLVREQARRELREGELLSWLSGKMKVVHVDVRDDGESAIAYGYDGLEQGVSNEQRWLLVRKNNRWLLADSELCDYGRWRSQMQARHYRFATRGRIWDAFDAVGTQASQAQDLLENGETEKAERLALQVDVARVDRELQDEVRMRLVHILLSCSDEAALRVARQFNDPGQWPGANFAIAHAEARLKHWPEAIAAAERYMQQVGPTVGICQVLLSVYEAQLDEDGMARMRRHLLRVQPDDAMHLARLAELNDAGATEVVERLQKLPNGAKTALEVVRYIDHDLHAEAVEAMLQFLERTAPNSAELEEARAQVARDRGDTAGAAKIYVQAWEKHRDDAELAERFSNGYLYAMAGEEKFQELAAEAPDPLAAVRFLASDFFDEQEYDVPLAALKTALERCRATASQDPVFLWNDGRVLLEDKQYAQAERQLQAAWQKLAIQNDDESLDRDSLAGAIAKSQLKQGRIEEAYNTVQLKATGAWELFAELDLKSEEERKVASTLALLHRQQKPQDPWAALMDAQLLAAQEKYEQAWQATPKSIPDEGGPGLAYQVRNLQADLLVKKHVPLSYCGSLADSDKLLPFVANRLADEQDWQRLSELVLAEERAGRTSSDPWLAWWTEMKFQNGELQEIVSRLEPQAADLAEKSTFSYRADGVGDPFDRLMRCLLRLGRYERTIQLAGQPRKYGQRDRVWLIWANLAAGNVAGAAAAADADGVYGHRVYRDREFGPLARAPNAQPLREKLPPDLPQAEFWQHSELLYSEPPGWDEVALTAAVQEALGETASVESLSEFLQSPGATSWQVTTGKEAFIIVSGERASSSDEVRPRHRRADQPGHAEENEALLKALHDYRGWTRLVPLQADEVDSTATCRLLAALAGEHCLAIRVNQDSRAIPYGDAARSALTSDKPAVELRKLGIPYFGWLVPPEKGEVERRTPEFWKAWMAFVRRLAQGPIEGARVRVRLEVGPCREEVSLRVVRLRGTPGRYCNLVVVADGPARLAPGIAPSEPYLLPSHLVQAIELPETP